MLYLGWKAKSGFKGPWFIRTQNMDLLTGMRELDLDPLPPVPKTLKNLPMRIFHGLF
jgi:hypothetical protein